MMATFLKFSKAHDWVIGFLYKSNKIRIHGGYPPPQKGKFYTVAQVNILCETCKAMTPGNSLYQNMLGSWHVRDVQKPTAFWEYQARKHFLDQGLFDLDSYFKRILGMRAEFNLIDECLIRHKIYAGGKYTAREIMNACEQITNGPVGLVAKVLKVMKNGEKTEEKNVLGGNVEQEDGTEKIKEMFLSEIQCAMRPMFTDTEIFKYFERVDARGPYRGCNPDTVLWICDESFKYPDPTETEKVHVVTGKDLVVKNAIKSAEQSVKQTVKRFVSRPDK